MDYTGKYLNKELSTDEQEISAGEVSYQEALNNDPEYKTWLIKLENDGMSEKENEDVCTKE